MKLVYRADNIAEGQIVKGMLEANGIEAYAGGYYLQGGVGEMSTMDFANIQVDDEDFAKAREIIQEYEAQRPAQPQAQVPESAAEKRTAFVAKLLIAFFAASATVFLIYLAAG